MAKLTSFHFDLGNSSAGPIGLCARVTARTAKRALEMLKESLPEELNLPHTEWTQKHEGEAIEYVRIYINPDAITTNDIDDYETINP